MAGRRGKPLEEIDQLVKDFSDASLLAKKAGFDGVQIHGAHAYLLCEFMKPSINKRADTYDESAENRFRLVMDIIKKIKSVCGFDFPVFLKIDVNDLDDREQYNEDLKIMLPLLKAQGVEAVEFSSSEFGTQLLHGPCLGTDARY